jgi:membrane-associated phospholipid phosphatase
MTLARESSDDTRVLAVRLTDRSPNAYIVGIYVTSVVKDIAQIPRPLAPPVTRLSLEYHALEYGFPSSHCGSTTTFAAFYFMLLARATGEVGLLGWVGGPGQCLSSPVAAQTQLPLTS